MPAGAREDNVIVINAEAVIDGTGKEPVSRGSVVVQGNKIVWVGKTSELQASSKYSGAKTIDAPGKTVMPGMVECHLHMFANTPYEIVPEDQIDLSPVQWVVLGATHAISMILKSGFTSVVGAGTAFNTDFWIRQAIERGLLVGPRVLPASREITSTGGYVDWTPSWWPKMVGFGITVDGPQEALKVARQVMKEGAQVVKIYPSGEGTFIEKYHKYFHDCRKEREVMTFDEIDALSREVHRWDRIVMAHCRNEVSVKNCLNAGVDVINHATYLDDECLRLFREKPPIAVCPALGYVWHMLRQEGWDPEYLKDTHYEEEYKSGCENMKILNKMGVKIVPGGDYGQSGIPHGVNAKDLELFVNDMDFTPLETLSMATKNGSYVMRMEDQIGTLEAGKLADLLIVDGDPLENIAILQDRRKLTLVMKDGKAVASQGKITSRDWDLLEGDFFEMVKKAASEEEKIPMTVR
jgi:imidazolonepropionase-like amidohydrolase